MPGISCRDHQQITKLIADKPLYRIQVSAQRSSHLVNRTLAELVGWDGVASLAVITLCREDRPGGAGRPTRGGVGELLSPLIYLPWAGGLNCIITQSRYYSEPLFRLNDPAYPLRADIPSQYIYVLCIRLAFVMPIPRRAINQLIIILIRAHPIHL